MGNCPLCGQPLDGKDFILKFNFNLGRSEYLCEDCLSELEEEYWQDFRVKKFLRTVAGKENS